MTGMDKIKIITKHITLSHVNFKSAGKKPLRV